MDDVQIKCIKIKFFLPLNFATANICVVTCLAQDGTRMSGIISFNYPLVISIYMKETHKLYEVDNFILIKEFIQKWQILWYY